MYLVSNPCSWGYPIRRSLRTHAWVPPQNTSAIRKLHPHDTIAFTAPRKRWQTTQNICADIILHVHKLRPETTPTFDGNLVHTGENAIAQCQAMLQIQNHTRVTQQPPSAVLLNVSWRKYLCDKFGCVQCIQCVQCMGPHLPLGEGVSSSAYCTRVPWMMRCGLPPRRPIPNKHTPNQRKGWLQNGIHNSRASPHRRHAAETPRIIHLQISHIRSSTRYSSVHSRHSV